MADYSDTTDDSVRILNSDALAAAHEESDNTSSSRRNTRNWGKFPDISDASDVNNENAPNNPFGENFMLRERGVQKVGNKVENIDDVSQTTDIDNETVRPRTAHPVPPKRMNIPEPVTNINVNSDSSDTESSDDEDDVMTQSFRGENINLPNDLRPPPLSVDRSMGPGRGKISSPNPTLSRFPESAYATVNSAHLEAGDQQNELPESVQQQQTATLHGTDEQTVPAVHFEEKEAEEEKTSDLDHRSWDVFRVYRYDSAIYACEGLIRILTKILKVVFIIISFVLILASLVISKLSLLFATSNLNQDVGFRKNGAPDEPAGGAGTRWGVPVQYEKDEYKDRDVVRWLWCILLCMCTPYVLTLLSSVWTILFKTKRSPKWRALCLVLVVETLHTCGIMILVFLVMPYMDIFRGMFLMNATSLLPSLLKLFCHPQDQKHRALQIAADATAFVFQLAPLALFPGLTYASHATACGDAESYNDTENNSSATTALYTTMTAYMTSGIVDNDSSTTAPYTTMTDYMTSGDAQRYDCTVNSNSVANTLYTTMAAYMTSGGTEGYNYTENMTVYAPNVSVLYTSCTQGCEYVQDPAIYLIPVALLLTSATWWQNFIDKPQKKKNNPVDPPQKKKKTFAQTLYKLSREVKRSKTKIWAVVSFWKLVLSFGLLLLGIYIFYPNYDYSETYNVFDALFGKNLNSSSAFRDHRYENNQNLPFEGDWLVIFAASAVSGFIGYAISFDAIQAKVQVLTYSSAILAATPVTLIIALFGFCGCDNNRSLMADALHIDDLYWNCYDGFETFGELVTERYIVLLGLVWWVGQLIITRHLWMPRIERIASADRIFVQPLYCGLLLEQSFSLNRSRHDLQKKSEGRLPRYLDAVTVDNEASRPAEQKVRHGLSDDLIHMNHDVLDDHEDDTNFMMKDEILYDRADLSETMIFICATMWHETEREMLQMIKSIIRLDRDQCHKKLARDCFKVRVLDYYDFEGHIFFDDAYNKYVPGDPETTVNRFVAMFVRIIDEAASYVHSARISVAPPKKIPTPYGGKLMYTLPGGNLLYLHLKDKQKIRHRKRWSQVMYMYYLLGHRLWDQPLKRSTKVKVAHNTYLLTLDGDVDFKPEAVMLLVDLMRRSSGVGAACGRIHPAGSGPMVWYQKFEYAISHWLQKTTEHVLGCVLCSPGCFSLFRASALMDDNIMKTYSQTAEEALHYVQYDQGEDRWLCTLLLQRGYRVEYSAAADALTFAPEGFNEFFNQRRRWTPSTFANIMDLLSTGGATAKRNENISILYIIYQGGLMFSSVLGPATIFLMVVSAFDTVLPSLGMNWAFILVLIPVGVYFALCMLAKSSVQLVFGALLAGLFAIAQMVVLVGLIVAIASDGLCSPTAWFLLGTTAIFVIAGVLHPQEMMVLIHGILYFVLIPTMYLLLIIYSLCNMHVVSWGTREVVQTTAEQEKLKQREMELALENATGAKPAAHTSGAKPAAPAAATGAKSMIGSLFGGVAASGGEDGWTWGCGDICRCMCCPRPGESITDATITKLQKRATLLTATVESRNNQESSSDSDTLMNTDDADPSRPLLHRAPPREDELPAPDYDSDDTQSSQDSEDVPVVTHDPAKPFWTQDINAVGKGEVGSIDDKEVKFWDNLIRRYLLPIDQNPEREERIKKELLSLRNKAVIAFFMIDLLFITLIQAVQTFPVPPEETSGGGNTTMAPEPDGYYLKFTCYDPVNDIYQEQQIEPVGFAFLMVFGLFLIIQFLGMLWHRLFSLIQIVSATGLKEDKSVNNMSYLKIVEIMAKMAGPDSPDTLSESSGLDSRRPSIQSQDVDDVEAGMEQSQQHPGRVMKRLESEPKVYGTIGKVFAQNYLALKQQLSTSEDDMSHPESSRSLPTPRTSGVETSQPPPPSLPPRQPLVNQMSKAKLSRSETRAQADVMSDLARRRNRIFTPESERQLMNNLKN